MNRSELIEIVKKIKQIPGSEDELNNLVDIFESNVPDPDAVDYLFQKQYTSLTPEDIVDKALSYKPFYL